MIWKKYPGRKELLIAYIEQPFSNRNLETSKNEPKNEKKYDLELINNPPIVEIVRCLTVISYYHFDIQESRITVYGWHKPNVEQKSPYN